MCPKGSNIVPESQLFAIIRFMSESQPSEKDRAAIALEKRSLDLLSRREGPSFSNLVAISRAAERTDLVPQIEKVGALQGLETAILVVSKYLETKDTSVNEFLTHDLGFACNLARPFDSEIGDVLHELYESSKTIGTPEEPNYREILERLQVLQAKHPLDLETEFHTLRDMLGIDPIELEKQVTKYEPYRLP